MSSNYVLYVAPFNFPNGGAAARRVYGNCLTLRKAGYKVVVASGQSCKDVVSYDGISVHYYNERVYEFLPRYLKHFFYFNAGAKLIEFLDKIEEKPKAIFLYSGYSPYIIRLNKWCKLNGVKLIFDAVEWYDPPSILAKFFSPYYLNIEFAMRVLIPKCNGVIAISKYLENYYKEFTLNVVRIPPTIDNLSINPRLESVERDFLKVCYAGSIGIKKELLGSIISAVDKVRKSGLRIQLHLAGLTFEDLISNKFLCRAHDKDLLEHIHVHGVLDHSSSVELVKDSDFSIVFRPNNRNVNAGFPTKFVESMAVGTPVIANLFSDVGEYLEDGSNGIICQGFETENLEIALYRAFELRSETSLRKMARELALTRFSVGNYTEELVSLIEN